MENVLLDESSVSISILGGWNVHNNELLGYAPETLTKQQETEA